MIFLFQPPLHGDYGHVPLHLDLNVGTGYLISVPHAFMASTLAISPVPQMGF